jgi:hypothetical protein
LRDEWGGNSLGEARLRMLKSEYKDGRSSQLNSQERLTSQLNTSPASSNSDKSTKANNLLPINAMLVCTLPGLVGQVRSPDEMLTSSSSFPPSSSSAFSAPRPSPRPPAATTTATAPTSRPSRRARSAAGATRPGVSRTPTTASSQTTTAASSRAQRASSPGARTP